MKSLITFTLIFIVSIAIASPHLPAQLDTWQEVSEKGIKIIPAIPTQMEDNSGREMIIYTILAFVTGIGLNLTIRKVREINGERK